MVDLWVCPEGLRRVPVYTGALNSHFCSRTQKRLPNGSQNGAFWAPKSELYSLGTICDKLVPKKLHQKKLQFSVKSRSVLGRGRRQGVGPWSLKICRIMQNCAELCSGVSHHAFRGAADYGKHASSVIEVDLSTLGAYLREFV